MTHDTFDATPDAHAIDAPIAWHGWAVALYADVAQTLACHQRDRRRHPPPQTPLSNLTPRAAAHMRFYGFARHARRLFDAATAMKHPNPKGKDQRSDGTKARGRTAAGESGRPDAHTQPEVNVDGGGEAQASGRNSATSAAETRRTERR